MKAQTKILVVEDDPSIRFGLQEVFAAKGFAVAVCRAGGSGRSGDRAQMPDLIILDIMLPGRNGFEICRDLRRRDCRVPILMLTAKGQEIDKVVGLDSGADDYVTKPFGVRDWWPASMPCGGVAGAREGKGSQALPMTASSRSAKPWSAGAPTR